MTLPSDGQFSGKSASTSVDLGDTPVYSGGFMRPSFAGFSAQYEQGTSTGSEPAPAGDSVQSWEMAQNDYPGFDPERSYLQNYSYGESFNDMDGVGAQTIAPTGNRGR